MNFNLQPNILILPIYISEDLPPTRLQLNFLLIFKIL